MTDKNVPKVFALVLDADEPWHIVGYGMVLPDGSVYSVSWPTGRGTSFSSASSAEETAALSGVDVLWMSDQPQGVVHGNDQLGWAARLTRGVLRALGVGARTS
jgi:hypothetical protein